MHIDGNRGWEDGAWSSWLQDARADAASRRSWARRTRQARLGTASSFSLSCVWNIVMFRQLGFASICTEFVWCTRQPEIEIISLWFLWLMWSVLLLFIFLELLWSWTPVTTAFRDRCRRASSPLPPIPHGYNLRRSSSRNNPPDLFFLPLFIPSVLTLSLLYCDYELRVSIWNR
jgi:hypothetical protein